MALFTAVRRTASVLALGLVPFALVDTAHAAPRVGATVAEKDGRLVYTAAPGVVNDVAVSVRWNTAQDKLVYLIDDAVRIKAGGPCIHPDEDDTTKVRCTLTPPDETDQKPVLNLKLGDRNDSVSLVDRTGKGEFFNTVALGPGADRYKGSTTEIDRNLVLGHTGNDTIEAGAQAAVMSGDGNDRITLSGADSAASAGPGDDEIRAGAGFQHLIGGPGDDRIWGGAGNDQIFGEDGNDRLWGQGGNDLIRGDNGNDHIWGGKGDDVLRGGPGRNVVKQ
ncbi:hypothetical protein LWF15_09820 [Kineosporia rhizophila]|uniref:calcium-binding protein n=1 Tax=Kineosporia rhizophila TaxID=84633 RepID=UPI001E4EE1D5|nr:calcium-binding protein [Kineosporia rhizophila]MCE0535809.1 hypothetical protein [Kineosporia rhizophila]